MPGTSGVAAVSSAAAAAALMISHATKKTATIERPKAVQLCERQQHLASAARQWQPA